MADWKYIMFEARGVHVPIIFPNSLTHADVAQRLQLVVSDQLKDYAQVVSAGFITGLVAVATEGLSETLNIKSRRADRAIINEMPYAGGRTDGLSCEPMVIEAVMRQLNPARVMTVTAEQHGHLRAQVADRDRHEYRKGRCVKCGAARGRMHSC